MGDPPGATAPDELTVERLLGRLQVLTAATHAFAVAATDPQRVLDTIVRRTAESLGGFCAVTMVSDDGLWLVPRAYWDPDPDVRRVAANLFAVAPFPIDSSVQPSVVVRTGKPHLERVVALAPLLAHTGPHLDARDHEVLLRMKSALHVPINSGGRTIGCLAIVRLGVGAESLDEHDLELAETLAAHAACAIATAGLLADRDQMSARLRLISDAAREFSTATDDFHRLVLVISRRLCDVLGDGCVIRLVSADGQWLEAPVAVHHVDPALVPAIRDAIAAAPQRVGDGMAGRVAATGEPVLLPTIEPGELAGLNLASNAALVERLAIRSLVAAPLITRGAVIGVVSVARSRAGHPYDHDDLALLQDLASHAALAIANSRLVQSLQAEQEERTRAEDALRRSEDQLRQAQKMEAVGRLAGGIAHDFNNMLSVILSYSSITIGELAPGDRIRVRLEEIVKAGERAADMTRQLLAFSRQQVIEPRVLEVGELVTSIEALVRHVIGEDVELEVIAQPSAGKIKADPGQIERVILNLVVNARDAMPQGGRLIISTSAAEVDEELARELGIAPGAHVVLSVRDTGVGMDRATRDQIFEPFFTTKERGRGTGLGLATVFGIVRQSGGGIAVRSEPGSGSTFEIYLPRTLELSSTIRRDVPVTTVRGSETILLVEDEDQLRAVAADILEHHGYHVLPARDGTEGLRLAEEHAGPIDLLLTDVVMPRMSGNDLATRLASLRPAVRVLFMSGYTADAILDHGVLEPSISVLQKPVTPESLLYKVRQALES